MEECFNPRHAACRRKLSCQASPQRRTQCTGPDCGKLHLPFHTATLMVCEACFGCQHAPVLRTCDRHLQSPQQGPVQPMSSASLDTS